MNKAMKRMMQNKNFQERFKEPHERDRSGDHYRIMMFKENPYKGHPLCRKEDQDDNESTDQT